jgi:hypothetical protein
MDYSSVTEINSLRSRRFAEEKWTTDLMVADQRDKEAAN